MPSDKGKLAVAWPMPKIIRGKTWREFLDSTTFHGVSNIFDREHSILRRVLWGIIVLIAIALFLFQVITRTIDFAYKETTVDVEVIYTGKLNYPTVTVCNQNKFKLTRTSNIGLYKFVHNFYSVNKRLESEKMLPQGFSMDTEYIYRTTGHQKKDLIYSCVWAGQPCTESQVVETVTEYGICYTFNSMRSENQSALLTVSESGTANALSLILNIEQYEYMNGPDNDAGVKIFLHNDYTRPLMTDLGFAVASGTHTLVGVRRIESYSLAEPYGDCVNSKFKSHAECVDRCRMRVVSERCNCIPFEASTILSPNNSTMKICHISKNLICVTRELENVKKDKNLCSCLVPCNQVVYEPSLSYSKISQLSADKVTLGDKNLLGNLRKSLSLATEHGEVFAEERKEHNKLIMHDFKEKIEKYSSAIGTLESLILKTDGYSKNFPKIDMIVEIIGEDLEITKQNILKAADYSETKKIEKLKKYIEDFTKELKKRINDIKLEDTHVAILDIEDCFRRNGNNSNVLWNCDDLKSPFGDFKDGLGPSGPSGPSGPKGPSGPRYYWALFTNTNQATILFSGLKTYEQEFTDEIFRIYGHNLTDPVMKVMYDDCKGLSVLTGKYHELEESTKVLGQNNTLAEKKAGYLKWFGIVESLWNTAKELEKKCFEFSRKSYWMSQLNIDGVINNFKKADSKFNIYFGELTKYLNNTKEKIGRIETVNNMMMNYLKLTNYSSSLTKDMIYKSMSTSTIDKDLNELSLSEQYISPISVNFETTLFASMNVVRNLQEDFKKKITWPFPVIDHDGNATSPQPLNYPNLSAKYHKDIIKDEKCLNIDWKLNNFYHCVNLLLLGFKYELEGKVKHISKKGYELDKSAKVLKEELNSFKNSLKVDGPFFFQNFAKVDIYYKELSYQKIQQSEKFKFLSLISEIGGFMGLLLGASVLTMIELMEYFLVNAISKMIHSDGKKNNSVSSLRSFANCNEINTLDQQKK